jgi:hypothetical protein
MKSFAMHELRSARQGGQSEKMRHPKNKRKREARPLRGPETCGEDMVGDRRGLGPGEVRTSSLAYVPH